MVGILSRISGLHAMWKHKQKVLVPVIVALITVSTLAAIVTAEVVISAFSKGLVYDDIDAIPAAETALVLGCSQYLENGQPNPFFSYRIEKAHALFVAGKVQSVIVSGDNNAVGYDEPTDMQEALIALGVPKDNIFCDYAGFSTLDSVVRAKEIFGQNELVVVSQAFHNRRAVFIGRSKGMTLYGTNARDVALKHGLKTRIREKLAKVKTVLDVWILGREPKFMGEKITLEPA